MNAKNSLPFTLVQPNIIWEQKSENLAHYEKLLALTKQPKGVVVLPEMFSTGFSMRPETLAEKMDGHAVQWMIQMAVQHKCIMSGSLIIEEEGHYYNRFLWVQPDGKIFHYDKRHLFGFAHEDQHYTAGENRVVVQVNGWKILLQVCYDLRFPVWTRNAEEAYDVIIYVANWPEGRKYAWQTLLKARAIENQAYVIGVNRVGDDANGNHYSGNSAAIDAFGQIIWEEENKEIVKQLSLSKDELMQTRQQLPFLKDADKFLLL